MGLIITEEEAAKRLGNPENLANKRGFRIQDEYNKQRPNGPNNDNDQPASIRPINNGGRREGDSNVPPVIRAAAALLAQSGEPTREIAQALGVSKSAVDQYKEGNTSFGRPNKELRAVLKQNMEQVNEKAVSRLLKGLDFMDFDNQEKMAKVSYRDMAAILLNLGKLVDSKLQNEDSDKESTRLIVYAPTVRTEANFSVIEVRESF